MAWALEAEGGYKSTDLQRYFAAEVPEKDETKRIISILNPDLDKLFRLIKEHDPRLYQRVVPVGSYYQGLKVRRSDEFDYTLCIDIPRDVVSRGHSAMYADRCYVRTAADERGKLFYGFKGRDSEQEHLAHTIPQVWYTA